MNGLRFSDEFADCLVEFFLTEGVEVLTGMKVFKGYEDGSFLPKNAITRAEVAAVTCRLLERSADQTYIRSHIGELRTFADVTESHWAYWYAMEAANGHDYTKSGGSENWSRTHR